MNDTDSEKFRTIWADGIPLPDYIESRAQDLKLSLGAYTPAHNEARTNAISDLVAGRLAAYGRRSSDHYDIEWIDPRLWVGAVLADDDDSISRRDYETYVSIRVCKTVNASRKVLELPESEQLSEPVRLSHSPTTEQPVPKELIPVVIEHFVSQDPQWLKGRVRPDDRYESYRSYMRQQGFDPTLRGFRDKNFEHYETESRKKNG